MLFKRETAEAENLIRARRLSQNKYSASACQENEQSKFRKNHPTLRMYSFISVSGAVLLGLLRKPGLQ